MHLCRGGVSAWLPQFSENWRLQYLLGVLYLQTDQQDSALKVFERLRKAEGEISDLPPTGLPIIKRSRELIWGEEMNWLIRKSTAPVLPERIISMI